MEYCTLECDLRMLPAMLMLATTSHAWLVCLDKFDDRGRSLLEDSSALSALLADADILKVGVGSSMDARKLLQWMVASQPIRGVVDLNDVDGAALLSAGDGRGGQSAFQDRSLRGWCEALLGRTLAKRKHKGKKQSKASKRAHWRAKVLTKDMKDYAATDAAAGLAVWEALVQRAEGNPEQERLLEAVQAEVELRASDMEAEMMRMHSGA